MMEVTLVEVIKRDKYFLPTLNGALFVAISGIIVLFFLGTAYAFALTIISALVTGPLYRFAPNTFQYLLNSFQGLGVSDHLIIFVLQLVAISSVLCIDNVRDKLWKTIQNLASEK